MDRFTRGFVAGAVAAVFEFLVALTLYYFNFTKLLWQDFASVLIYGRKPLLFWERVFAELSVWFFAGLMGIFLAYIIRSTGNSNYLFKGFVFAQAVWFTSFAITVLFDVPEFRIITFKTTISNFILAAIWGLITAEILQRLDNRSLVS